MRNTALALSAVLFLCFSTSSASAKDVTTTGQVMLAAGGGVGNFTAGQSQVDIYLHGTGFFDMGSGTGMLFGYFGPRFKIENTTVHLLTGLFLTPDGGTSVLGSVWFEQSKVFTDQLGWFLEFDTYFPMPTSGSGEHQELQYYLYSTLMHSATENFKWGLVTEHFFSAEEWGEAAVGPGFSVNDLMFWVGYDFTPTDKKQDMIIFRVCYNL
jgi:hypothetical protein